MFTIECAHSQGSFPALASFSNQIDWPDPASERENPVNEDIRFRIALLWGAYDSWWELVSQEEAAKCREESFESPSTFSEPSIDEALNKVEPSINDAIERIMKYAIPYFVKLCGASII